MSSYNKKLNPKGEAPGKRGAAQVTKEMEGEAGNGVRERFKQRE
ncbi:MAG: hypothetical protein ABL950_02390 [Nitrospira sp.]